MNVTKEGARGRVLICDDEPRLAALTVGLLEQFGYEAGLAASGEEALAELAREPTAVMLLDASIAGMTSMQILESLGEGGVPVLLMSGYSEEDLPEGVRSHPLVRGYLPKPFGVERLLEAIGDVLPARESAS